MNKQKGAVSIFIVIFTALLVTVVTTSFVQIMMRNQQQATNNDLSQSAYDSAMAGVEDAKRALVQLKKCQLAAKTGSPVTTECSNLTNLLTNNVQTCDMLDDAGVATFASGEAQVGSNTSLNQAYTCVKVKVQTESYKGSLDNDRASVVIPLVPIDANSSGTNTDELNNMSSVRISWFVKANLPDDTMTGQPKPLVMPPASQTNLPPATGAGSWGDATPPLMWAQLIQFDGTPGTSIDLGKFDDGNARTVLLYPKSGSRPSSASFANDSRRTSGMNRPSYGGCQANFNYGGYACSVVVDLVPMSGGEQRQAYLRLAGVYINNRGVNYQVEMMSPGVTDSLKFDNVQPEVDSTGRASDLFRRVKARVSVSDSGTPLPYPDAALSTDKLCKEFFITDDINEYDGNGNSSLPACTP